MNKPTICKNCKFIKEHRIFFWWKPDCAAGIRTSIDYVTGKERTQIELYPCKHKNDGNCRFYKSKYGGATEEELANSKA